MHLLIQWCIDIYNKWRIKHDKYILKFKIKIWFYALFLLILIVRQINTNKPHEILGF